MEVVTAVTVRQDATKWLLRQKTAKLRHQFSRPANPISDSWACMDCDIDESCVKKNIMMMKWDKNSTKQTKNKEANDEDNLYRCTVHFVQSFNQHTN